MKTRFSNYYPTDLVYGLLAAHVADESGAEAGHSFIKVGDAVIFSEKEALYQCFQNKHSLNLNNYLKSWQALRVIEDAQSGYLGVIYRNMEEKQLVLAHRSTNFELAFCTENIVKQSGWQADVESVFKGLFVRHQVYGYKATEIAVKLQKAEYKDYSLSTAGHSLGAWLAQMSIFYAYSDLKYHTIKAVTFDGPGAKEMMDQLTEGLLGQPLNINDLDITSYLSAPNVVNCSNHHVGNVYRLFPQIKDDYELVSKLTEILGVAPLKSTYGHHLKYILPYFDPNIGKPTHCQEVERWPSMTHNNHGNNKHISHTAVNDILNTLTGGFINGIIKSPIKIITNKFISSIFGAETTTLGSTLNLLYDFAKGNIDHKQFWKVHTYLEPENGYDAIHNNADRFGLTYEANYKVKDMQPNKQVVKGYIDKYIVAIKKYFSDSNAIGLAFSNDVKDFVKVYNITQELSQKYITVSNKYNITVEDIRDFTKKLLHNNPSLKELTISKKIDNIDNNPEAKKVFEYLSYLAPFKYLDYDFFNLFINKGYFNKQELESALNYLEPEFLPIHTSEAIQIKIKEKFCLTEKLKPKLQNILKIIGDIIPDVTEQYAPCWDQAKSNIQYVNNLLDFCQRKDFSSELNKKLGLIYSYILFDHKKALDYFLTAYEKESCDINTQNIIATYVKLGNYDKALELSKNSTISFELLQKIGQIKKAQEFAETKINSTNNKLEKIDYYNKLFSLTIKSNQYDKALTYLKLTKKLIDEVANISDSLNATYYNNFGQFSLKQNKIEEAIKHFKKSIELKEKFYSTSIHPEVANSYENLAFAYSLSKNFDESFINQNKALEIRTVLFLDKSTAYIVNSKDNLGLINISAGKFSDGIKLLNEAYTERKKLYDNYINSKPESENTYHNQIVLDIAVSFNNLAAVYEKKLNFQTAIDYRQQQIQYLKKFFGNIAHPEIALVYRKLGNDQLHMDDIKNAEKSLNTSLTIWQEFLGYTNNQEIAIVYEKLGFIYEKLNHATEEAIKLNKNASAIYESLHLGINQITCLKNLGYLYKNSDKNKAQDYFNKSQDIVNDNSQYYCTLQGEYFEGSDY